MDERTRTHFFNREASAFGEIVFSHLTGTDTSLDWRRSNPKYIELVGEMFGMHLLALQPANERALPTPMVGGFSPIWTPWTTD